MTRVIRESDIEDEIEVCSYCGDEKRNPVAGCCGEVHFEVVYLTTDGETYSKLTTEVEWGY